MCRWFLRSFRSLSLPYTIIYFYLLRLKLLGYQYWNAYWNPFSVIINFSVDSLKLLTNFETAYCYWHPPQNSLLCDLWCSLVPTCREIAQELTCLAVSGMIYRIDRGDRCPFSFWTCRLPLRYVFPFPLSPAKWRGDLFDKKRCGANKTFILYL